MFINYQIWLRLQQGIILTAYAYKNIDTIIAN